MEFHIKTTLTFYRNGWTFYRIRLLRKIKLFVTNNQWLPSAKANEFIDRSTSTPPSCLNADLWKLNFSKKTIIQRRELYKFITVRQKIKF